MADRHVTGRARRWRELQEWFAPPPQDGPGVRTTLGPSKDPKRKEWVQRYFRPAPPMERLHRGHRYVRLSGFTLVVGLVLLVVGLPGWAAGAAGLTAVLLGAGITAIRTYHVAFREAELKPTGAQLDGTLDADLVRAWHEAMRDFGLTVADLVLHTEDPAAVPHTEAGDAGQVVREGPGQPLVFAGPAPAAKHRPNWDDQVRRFTAYSVAIVCLAQDRLAVRTFELDLATGAQKDVDTHEYHYDHVAALNTTRRPGKDLAAREIVGFPARKPVLTVHELEITSTGGTRVLIGTEIAQPHPPGLTTTTSIENALPALRGMLRRVGVE